MDVQDYDYSSRPQSDDSLLDRERLLRAVEASRAGIILLSAPSGFGKTILARQITAGAATLWVHAGAGAPSPTAASMSGQRGEVGCARHLAEGMLTRDSGSGLLAEAEVLVGSASATPQWVVIDAVEAADPRAFTRAAVALRARLNPPVGLVITTRQDDFLADLPAECLAIDRASIAFDDREVAELVARCSGSGMDCAKRIMQASQGHPAVAVLLARQHALGGGAEPSRAESPGAYSTLWSLAHSQLGTDVIDTLRLASALGRGRGESLARAGCSDAFEQLRLCAGVLPLVKVDGDSRRWEFEIHDLARTAFAPDEYLGRLGGARALWLVQALLEGGELSRSVSAAVATADSAAIRESLHRAGDELLRRGEVDAVLRALGRLEACELLDHPRILLLKAKALYERGDPAGARDAARAVIDLARHACEDDVVADALLLVARMSFALGDQRECVDALADADALHAAASDAERRAYALAFSCQASAFLLDPDGLRTHMASAESVIRSARLPVEAREQLRFSQGVGAGLLFGDWPRMAALTAGVCRARGIGRSLRLLAGVNHAAALTEMGRLGAASEALERDVEEARLAGFKSIECAGLGTIAGIAATMDPSGSWEELARDAIEMGLEAGELGSTVLNAVYTSTASRACRRLDDSLAWAERAEWMLEGHNLPAVALCSKVERAASLLAIGDVTLSTALCADLGRDARRAEAAQIALKADMIREVARVRHSGVAEGHAIREHSDYITSGSTNWQVAMYVRAFPELLASVVEALPAAEVPSHLLRLIPDPYATEALAACVGRLPREDIDALSVRMLGHPFDRQVHASAEPVTQPAPACSVRLFGGFEVRTPGGPVPDKAWVKRKARLMFAMLAARPGKDVPREQIIEYLWPDMDEQRGLNNFYVAWSSMKRALSPRAGRDEACPYVEHVRGVCRLLTDAVTSDLIELESNLAIARKARSAGDTDSELAALQAVADLYRGELLPGDSYDDWFSSLRERCRHDFEDAMLRSAEILEARGELQAALALLRRALTHDPWREDLYQSALRLQIAAGQRSAAIETYMLCRTRLVEDLGIDPSGETTRLYEHVLGMEV